MGFPHVFQLIISRFRGIKILMIKPQVYVNKKVISRRPDKYNYKNKSNFVGKNKQKVWHIELHFCRKLLNIIFEPAEAYNVILDCNSSLNYILSGIL